MSDYDDDMELDAPAARDTVLFSSDNTAKGKRSAANLPVEAEDSLPWVEKYRPDTLDDVSGHQDILATINKFVDTNVRTTLRKDGFRAGRLTLRRDFPIYFYTGLLELERRQQSWHSPVESMDPRICARWCWNSMHLTTEESMLYENRLRHLQAQNKSSPWPQKRILPQWQRTSSSF